MWVVELYRELSEEFKLPARYPEWILVAIAAISAAFILIDPFHVPWQ